MEMAKMKYKLASGHQKKTGQHTEKGKKKKNKHLISKEIQTEKYMELKIFH